MTLTTVNAGMLDTQAQYTGFKNRIINGAMVISQANGTNAVTSLGTTVDRFGRDIDTDGASTFQQVTDAPSGFKNSLKFTTTTADASLTGVQRARTYQRIEGLNTYDMMFGAATASTITLSFWVKSSLTGSFGGAFSNSAFDRSYPFSYTINAASTWEYKTITVAGDTSGTWLTDNGIGIALNFSLGVASGFQGTANAWAAAGLLSPTGCVSVIGTLNATWQVTGVQLEKGSTATAFDYRPYGTELALCQRYYQKSYPQGTAPGTNLGSVNNPGVIQQSWGSSNAASIAAWVSNLPVTMRTTPTLTTYDIAATSGRIGVVSAGGTVTNGITPNLTLTSDANLMVRSYNDSAYGLAFSYTLSAEL